MPTSLAEGTVVAGNTVFILAVLFYGFLPQRRLVLLSPRKLTQFRHDFYRPMERLFSEADFRCIATSDIERARIVSMFRRRRIAVYHRYLGYLLSDYRKLASAVKISFVAAASDRPDLALDMLRARLGFGFEVIAMEWRLLFYRFGIAQADVSPLLAALDAVRASVTAPPSERVIAFA